MEQNIGNLTTTAMNNGGVPNFAVSSKSLDEPSPGNATNYWQSPNWSTYLGYLQSIPEVSNAVRAKAMWTCGLGWTTQLSSDKVILEHVTGWGKETIDAIFQDALIVSEINGDSFAEIIKDDSGVLINLKKLNPGKTRVHYDEKGTITHYEYQKADGTFQHLDKTDVFHLTNDRIANQIHGTSKLQNTMFIIDWVNEIFADLRRLMHRSSLRVAYVDPDDVTKLSTMKEQYKEAVRNGEVLFLPGRKGQDFEIADYAIPPTAAYIEVLNFVTNYFYEVFGVPKIVTGGTQQFTEASSKIGYQTFEVPHKAKRRYLEQEIWNQLGIKIDFDEPASLMDNMQSDEAANTGQMNFQPNAVTMGSGK